MNRLLAILCVLLIALVPIGSSHATTRTPLSPEPHILTGFCADIDNDSMASWHFCAKQVKDGPKTVMSFVIYVELYADRHLAIDNNQIVIVNKKTRHELKYTVDAQVKGSIDEAPEIQSKVTAYVLSVPEILVRLLGEGKPIESYVEIQGTKVWFKPTPEELKEIRMIAIMEAM